MRERGEGERGDVGVTWPVLIIKSTARNSAIVASYSRPMYTELSKPSKANLLKRVPAQVFGSFGNAAEGL